MVQVDKNLCISCGVCFGVHSQFFALWTDGKAEAIKQPTTDEERASVQDAIVSCPATAISE